MNRPLALAVAMMLAPALPAQAAPGEIPLHIDARGTVVPDVVTLPVPLSGAGATADEARAQLLAMRDQTVAELTGMGLPADAAVLSDIAVNQRPAACSSEISCDAMMVDAASAAVDAAAAADGKKPRKKSKKEKQAEKEAAEAMLQPSWAASATLTVQMDPAQIDKLQGGTFAGLEDWRYMMLMQGGRMFGFRDPAAAHAKALDLAIASARAEADLYAGALGYRVVRIAGVTNTPNPVSAGDLLSLFSKLDRAGRDPIGMNSEVVSVGIDFVIAPK